MRTLSLFLFALVFFGNTIASAQDENPYANVSIATPNAASLGKYGDIPVSYHTGVPQISIPIHTIQEGSLTLPISLSYHASGLKVMELSSWVGAGWALNAGGVISRTVRGSSDERFVSRADQNKGHYSDYGFSSYIENPDTLKENWIDVQIGRLDGEPDLYRFSFNGYSGSFYFQDDRTPVLVPDQDLKIEPVYPDTTESFDSWIVTTPDGTRYYFGQGSGKETTKPITEADFNYFNSLKVVSSWYLTRIESHDRQKSIVLTYEPEDYSYYTVSMFPTQFTSNLGYKLVKNFVNGVRLKEIHYSTGKIILQPGEAREDLMGGSLAMEESPNADAKTLGRIEIWDSDSTRCRKFKFSYGYFHDSTTPLHGNFSPLSSYEINSDRKRLRLDTLKELSCDLLTQKQPYVFTYYDAGSVPRRLTFAQDHWGYYNGSISNNSLIPDIWINLDLQPGADREASWPEMRAGSLHEIQYPTGGSTEFTYGAHDTWLEYTQPEKGSMLADLDAGYGQQFSYHVELQLSPGTYLITVSAHQDAASGTVSLEHLQGSAPLDQPFIDGVGAGESDAFFVQVSGGTYKFTVSTDTGPIFHGAEGKLFATTEVAYELNETIGGLRIQSIQNHDGSATGLDVVTNYTYSDPNTGHSNGILYSRPIYIGILRNEMVKKVGYRDLNGEWQDCSTNGCFTCDDLLPDEQLAYFVSPASLFPMQTSQGNHIGYSQVRVEQGSGASRGANGYSVYTYEAAQQDPGVLDDVAHRRIELDECLAGSPNFPAAPIPHNFIRGLLLEEAHFNDLGVIRERTTYQYSFTPDQVSAEGIIVSVVPGSSGVLWGTRYEFKSAKKTYERVEKRTYDDDGIRSVLNTTERYFDSPHHNQVTQTSTVANGYDLISRLSYSADMQAFSVSFADTCDLDFVLDSIFCENYYAQDPQGYFNCLREKRTTYVSCRQALEWTYDSLFDANYGPADLEVKAILDMQANNQLQPVEVTHWKDDHLIQGIFTRFADIESDRKSIFPDTTYRLYPSDPMHGANFTFADIYGAAVSKDPLYKPETNYEYESGNLISVLPANGINTCYIWGYNQTLPIAKIDNATYDQVEDALGGPGFSLDGENGNTLSDTQLQDLREYLPRALVTSYTYEPTIGMASQTDPNGLKTRYQYDELGRLLRVRDHENNILKAFEYRYHDQ